MRPRNLILVGVCALAILALPNQALALDRDAIIEKMVDYVNAERRQHGLREIHPAPKLMGSAQRVSGSLMRRDVFAHSSLVTDRRSRVEGETLEMHSGGRPQPRLAFRVLMGSPYHRALILGSRMRHLGAGFSRGRFRGPQAVIWVLHVGH